jgi:hypothetical protein
MRSSPERARALPESIRGMAAGLSEKRAVVLRCNAAVRWLLRGIIVLAMVAV